MKPHPSVEATLHRLLPLGSRAKRLREIREQLRLLNEIRIPSDDALARVIVGYFQETRFDREVRFYKVDRTLGDDDPSSRWTRVRVGEPARPEKSEVGGEPPNKEQLLGKIDQVLQVYSAQAGQSFFLWDVLSQHFGITSDNNRYYHRWLEELAGILGEQPQCVIVAVDDGTGIPVEWMIAVDHSEVIADLVSQQIDRIVKYIKSTGVLHLTRDLVQRSFAGSLEDETLDLHTFYVVLSGKLAVLPELEKVHVYEHTSTAEAWTHPQRVEAFAQSRLDSMVKWFADTNAPQGIGAVTRFCLQPIGRLTNTDSFEPLIERVLYDDGRFVLGTDGRWSLRYQLSADDLEQLISALEENTDGLPLDVLIASVLGRDAYKTDAHQVLSGDPRFAESAGIWQLSSAAMYRLTDDDVEMLLAELEQLGRIQRLETLVHRILDHNVSETDAEQRLRNDDRFEEVQPGFWKAASIDLLVLERRAASNLPISSISPGEATDQELEGINGLTERVSRRGDLQQSRDRRQLTITLLPLDVDSGSLVISSAIRDMMGSDLHALQVFQPESGSEFVCWVDKEENLLRGFEGWFGELALAPGDKIQIVRADPEGVLGITYTGERDERVFRQALERSDADRIKEDAKLAGRSYHDLMIEVMRDHDQPLHRDDIYELVNEIRIANRGTIFSILSLHDCGFEELRYFVSHGEGYWSYDANRKKRHDMKMRELIDQVEELERELDRLHTSVTDREQRIADLERELADLRASESEIVVDDTHCKQDHMEIKLLEMVADRDNLADELEKLRTRFEGLNADKRAAEAAAQAAQESADEVQAASDALHADILDLQNKLETVRRALGTPMGRAFSWVHRALGGPNLLDL